MNRRYNDINSIFQVKVNVYNEGPRKYQMSFKYKLRKLDETEEQKYNTIDVYCNELEKEEGGRITV